MKRFIRRWVPQFMLDVYHFAFAFVAARWYRFPTRTMGVIGVLGTRGKTTAANLIWSILTASGYTVGLTGTANIRIGEKEMMNPYHMTMPGKFTLQRLLSRMKHAGCDFVVVETPSEGIEQFRHLGIAYDILVLMRLYPEYLETHRWDPERAVELERRVFHALIRQPRKAIRGQTIPKAIILDRESPDHERFRGYAADRILTYSAGGDADVSARHIRSAEDGASFEVDGVEYRLNLRGLFNVSNALAAIAAARALGIPDDATRDGLARLRVVPGRMEEIHCGQNFSVFVDYAHDPVALRAALDAAAQFKKRKGARLVVLTGGQGGGRSQEKLYEMGKIAAARADCIVVTNEDPYDDDPIAIMEKIRLGAEEGGKMRDQNLFIAYERREGIRKALALANAGGVVLVAGKGAEQSMMVKGGPVAWDDRVIVRSELMKLESARHDR